MGVNTQSVGRILSVQKIVVGGIERTPEGAVTDGKVTQYMLIRGSTGNDAIVDSNGNLVCMLKGSENLPIAQDASGNMVAVMKGDYAGVLKTWKVDNEGRGEMFISDPIDVWGNANIIGLIELAARAHTPPMVYDASGNVIQWDNFESSTKKYTEVVSNGSVARTTDFAWDGDFSLKCMTDAVANAYAGVKYHLPDFHNNTNIAAQYRFASDDSNIIQRLLIEYFDGTHNHLFHMRWNNETLNLEIIDDTGSWQIVGTSINYYRDNRNFGSIKMVVDLNTDYYVRCLIFGYEFDISAYSITPSVDASRRHLRTSAIMENNALVTRTGYMDNVIVTENVS